MRVPTATSMGSGPVGVFKGLLHTRMVMGNYRPTGRPQCILAPYAARRARAVIDSSVMDRSSPSAPSIELLTQREREALRWVAEHRLSKEIALDGGLQVARRRPGRERLPQAGRQRPGAAARVLSAHEQVVPGAPNGPGAPRPAMGPNPTATQWDYLPPSDRRPLPSRQPLLRRTRIVTTTVMNDNEAPPLTGARLGVLVRKVLRIREAATAFEQDWPLLDNRPPMPVFAWTELERQLLSLAPEDLAPMVRDLVSAIRKEASPKPPEMVLREILIIAATVLDETFHEKWAEGTALS